MASVTSAGSTWNTTAGDKTVTATPAVNDLIVVIAASSGLAGGTTAVADDQGGTYTQVDSDRTGFSTTGVLTVWVRTALVSSAVSTVYTASQTGSSGGGLSVLRVAGVTLTGASAVRSNGGQSTGGAGATPAPVLSNTPLAIGIIISAVANGTNGGGVTQRGGYTDVTVAGYNTPATGLDICFLNRDETTATITWGGTSATAFASVAIEIEPPAPVVTSILTSTTTSVGTLPRRQAHYRLSAPAVVEHEAVFIAEPIRAFFRTAVHFRPPATSSILRLPLPEEPTPPPPVVSDENLAPIIYGYGAM